MVALSLLSLLLATVALASPTPRDDTIGACAVPASAVTLPQSFTPIPSSPSMVLLGVGSQNYTCNSNGAYDYVGAYAEMFDISCFYNTQVALSSIPNDAFNSWNLSYWPDLSSLDLQDITSLNVTVKLAIYGTFYSTQQNGVLTPVWDLTLNTNNASAIIYGQQVQSVHSPNGTNNTDWAEFKTSPGGWASNGIIYGIDTVGGQPPSSCIPGSSENFKYAATYWFS